MCGIVGVVGNLQGVDTAAMLDAIAARGPDDCGEWTDVDEGLWLGHRRLAIIDTSSAGHQPMFSADGSLAIVFNGEIYNYQELRDDLTRRGHVFATHTDTEVILAAFGERGLDCVGELKGMFAFAIWDRRRKSLFLARDRLGEKPLYFASVGGRFLFGSSVVALLASNVLDRQLDPDGLDAYLTFGSVADPLTLVRGVQALGAGTTMTVVDGQVTRRTYWDAGYIPSDVNRSRAAAVTLVRERFQQALARCMVADVPVGLLLSGGIDSSSNVVLLADRFPNLHTFSVVFEADDAALDESRYSDLVARQCKTTHHRVTMTIEAARALVSRGVAAMDQPSSDGINTFVVCDALHSEGVKVAISGQGADEIFLGYWQRRLFERLLLAARWTPAVVKSFLLYCQRFVPPGADSSVTKVMQTLTGPEALKSAYLAQHSTFSHAAVCRLRRSARPHPTRFIDDVAGESPLDSLSRLQVKNYLRNTLLRDADQMSMSYPVELRGPFLDADLVEAVLSTPARLRIDPERNKPLLLDAVGPALPREVWDRPKQGFALPYSRWLKNGLRVSDARADEMGLDQSAVDQIRRQFERTGRYARLWTLEVLGAWVKRHKIGTRFV